MPINGISIVITTIILSEIKVNIPSLLHSEETHSYAHIHQPRSLVNASNTSHALRPVDIYSPVASTTNDAQTQHGHRPF